MVLYNKHKDRKDHVQKRAERTEVTTDITGALIIDENFALLNISDSGVLINTSHKLELGNIYFLMFKFLDKDKKFSLQLKSKVMREKLCTFAQTKAGSKEPVYEVGLSFVDSSKDDVKNLKLLIAQKELHKVQQ
jgi:hypothetical protein